MITEQQNLLHTCSTSSSSFTAQQLCTSDNTSMPPTNKKQLRQTHYHTVTTNKTDKHYSLNVNKSNILVRTKPYIISTRLKHI